MGRRRKEEEVAFGTLSFIDVLANSVGALVFIFLMFFFVTAVLVDPVKFRLVTDFLPAAQIGTEYRANLTAAGGSEPYRWRVVDGALPEGMALDKRQGTLVGSPRKEGYYSITVGVSDSSYGKPLSLTKTFELNVRSAGAASAESGARPLTINTENLPSALVDSNYSVTLAATGGREPYSWSTPHGLPAGLRLVGDKLIGVPQRAGASRLSLRVNDGLSTVSKELIFTAKEPPVLTKDQVRPVRIISTRLARAVADQSYYSALNAVGGIPPYTWKINRGALPRGLKLTAGTGVISGTPESQENARLTVALTDSQTPPLTAEKTFSLSVFPLAEQYGATYLPLPWWLIIPAAMGTAVAIFMFIGASLGVQCPWDKSWGCRIVGKDENGRDIYQCRHGHRFITEVKEVKTTNAA